MEEKLNYLKSSTAELLNKLGFPAEVTVAEEAGHLKAVVTGENLGILIGYHGETLLSIQTWLGQALYTKYGEWLEVSLDIAGYAAEREQRLRDIATNAADRARFLDKPIELSPMSAYERRFVHTVIAEIPGMLSESTGEGFDRRVVVSVDKPEKSE